jgi:hypothetical protein
MLYSFWISRLFYFGNLYIDPAPGSTEGVGDALYLQLIISCQYGRTHLSGRVRKPHKIARQLAKEDDRHARTLDE